MLQHLKICKSETTEFVLYLQHNCVCVYLCVGGGKKERESFGDGLRDDTTLSSAY